jgi:rubrerythrin
VNLKTTRIIQTAVGVELLAQGLYAEVACTFSDRPPMRDLFLRLAEEEGQHAGCLRLLDRHRVKAPIATDAMDRIRSGLEGLSENIESLRKELRSSALRRDPYAALGRLAEMESRFGSVHASEIAEVAYPSMRKMFEALERQDLEHARLITWAKHRLAA